jgi:hypothetical protein
MTKQILAVLTFTLASFAASAPDLAGLDIRVRSNVTLHSKTARSGQTWDGSLANDIVKDGVTLYRRGTAVEGIVVSAVSAKAADTARLELKLTAVNGEKLSASTEPVEGTVTKKRASRTMTGWALTGALVGGILYGGKGAAAGAAAGAGVGAVRAQAKDKSEALIPAETVLTFRVD